MSQGSLSYRPEIDGLRALAVIPVVLFHAGLGVPGGYVGVDVFFVISGFLITKLILKDIESDRFSILDFWERRVRRIFPALYVMLFVTLIAGFFLFLPWDYEDLGRSAMMQSIFSSNFYFWKESGYFDGPAEVKPLLHTWSLAVEEQFYLLFPALLLFIWKRSSMLTYRVLLGIWGVSFVVSAIGIYHFPSASFYLLPMRAWELLTGALLAVRKSEGRASSRIREVSSATGVALILFACVTFSSNTRFPGPSALLPCLGTALFLWSNEGKLTAFGRLLSWKPIVFIGLISYSLYLWHWPVIAYANRIFIEEMTPLIAGLVMLGSLGMAIVSWHFVEKPFRKRSIGLNRSLLFKLAIGVSVASVLAGTLLDAFDGFPSRVPESVIRMSEQERNPKYQAKTTIADLEEGSLLRLGLRSEDKSQASFLLWGDSHAIAIAPAIDRLANEYDLSGVAAMRGGTPPMLEVWVNNTSIGEDIIPYNQAVVDFVAENGIDFVIIAARWAKYINGRRNDVLDGVVVDRQDPGVSTKAAERAFEHGVNRAVSALTKSGARIYIVKQVPDHADDIPREIADRMWRGKTVKGLGISSDQHERDQKVVEKVFDNLAEKGVFFVDPSPLLFGPEGEPRLIADGQSLYRDEDHVSDAGAYFLLPVLKEIFIDISQRLHPANVPRS